MVAALVALAVGNNLDIHPLCFVAGWSLLIIPMAWPMAWPMGWVRRTKEEAWAAENGPDADGVRAEIVADERRQDKEVTRYDWLVDSPWKRGRKAASSNQLPRFGGK